MNHLVIQAADLDRLLEALTQRGYELIGPTVKEGAIVYDRIASSADLPAGWTDEQEAGSYRLRPRADRALFGYAVGPHSWKKFLLPPEHRVWSAVRQGDGFSFESAPNPARQFAFIGVRACELRAIAIQDRVFLAAEHEESSYRTRREGAFLVAINCARAGGTCFCVSMGRGPKARSGFDLALTEVLRETDHCFVVEVGSPRGAEILASVPHREAVQDELERAERIVAQTASEMGRTMETEGIKELLYEQLEHPRWDDVAARCLTCGNCTMVCPTCFCTTVEDTADLSGDRAERWRKWDSCFTTDFSYLHGGVVRATARSRYRQWMTHKLATWIDQFGSSGCVGCGRCITWCPVGIDITEEMRAIRSGTGRDEQ